MCRFVMPIARLVRVIEGVRVGGLSATTSLRQTNCGVWFTFFLPCGKASGTSSLVRDRCALRRAVAV